jgi:two-component system sensor histidine kinase AtoS
MAGPDSRPRKGLQRRFFLSVAAVIAGLTLVVLFIVGSREQKLIRGEAEKRALSMATNLAATSDTALRTYNYIALEQYAEKAAREADLAYVIFLDKEGRVAAFSGQDERQGAALADPVSEAAQQATEPLVQETTWDPPGAEGTQPILDVAVPVFFRESAEKWGTVRIGLSLAPMQAELRRTQAVLLAVGLVALLLALAGVQFLVRRVTRPVEALAAGARRLAGGDVGLQLDIRTGDELEALARAFNHMSAELAAKQAALVQNLALVDALRRYQEDILRSMDEGLLTVDLDGRVVTVNRVGAALLGIPPERMDERPPLGSVIPAGAPLERLVRRGLDSGEVVGHAEVEYEAPGRTLPLGVSTAPLRDPQGARLGVLVLFRDLTDIKALEARMRRADRLAALGTMSAGLAHEIKNPLAAIKTFVQLIPRKFDNLAFRDKFNVTVPRELDRVNGIVDNLLELARAPRMNFAPTEVNALARRVLDLHSRQMEERRIEWDARLDPALPLARADAEYLLRALSNLVVNAAEAMLDGGRLIVATGPAAGRLPSGAHAIELRVADTGAGMDAQTVSQLFNPFFTTKAKGTGLGLALTHKIVEEHGGVITVQSAVGTGTLFVITLPVAQPA